MVSLLRSALMAATVLVLAGAAQAQTFTVGIEQGGRMLQGPDTLHLKRAPFTFVFTGPRSLSYGLMASTECDRVKSLVASGSWEALIGPYHIGAEGYDGKDSTWFVNREGVLASGLFNNQVWDDDEMLGFQSVTDGPKGKTVSRRTMETILYEPGEPEVPLAEVADAEICVMVTGLPPVGHFEPTGTRVLRLVFDR